MLQYWEGNLTYLLREIDNFQKTNNSDYFLLWYTSIQEGAFRQSSKQTDNDREASVYILLQVNENWIEAFKFNNPFSPDSVYLLGQLSKEDANSSTLDR